MASKTKWNVLFDIYTNTHENIMFILWFDVSDIIVWKHSKLLQFEIGDIDIYEISGSLIKFMWVHLMCESTALILKFLLRIFEKLSLKFLFKDLIFVFRFAIFKISRFFGK